MLEKFYRINQATGINIHTCTDGNLLISACRISVNKNQLDIETKIEGVSGFDKLKETLPAGSYLSVNLSGRGVLYKQVEKLENIDAINFNKILPNAVFDDFFVQNFISEEQSFVAIIRKSEADKWIAELKRLGYIPVMMSLGPFPADNVFPQLNFYDSTIVFNGYTIERSKQGRWESWSYNDSASSQFPIKIESETIHQRLVIPYAAAFQLVLADRIAPVTANNNNLEVELKSVRQSRKLKAQGGIILFVVFFLLLINFAFFSWLNSENSRLADQVSSTLQSTDDIQKIDNQVQLKEALLKKLGWEENINKSSLVDQVASLLPPEITWKQVTIDPVDITASRQQKTVIFSKRKLSITGFSEKIIPVNEWMARIKTKPWVKNVQLDSYSFNSTLNTGQFTILIDY